MVVDKFAKLLFKKNRHKCHPQPNEELSSSPLHDFDSHVSNYIDQLALELKSESEILSLSWIQRCFGLFPIINNVFAKLLVDIDYPMSRWEVDSIEGYLNYTKSLLDVLNSISSSLSHLGHARLSLAHGLTLVENKKPLSLARKHLKAIQPTCFSSNFGKYFHTQDDIAKIVSGKDLIVREGVKEMKSIGFWVCGVFLSCLYGDAKPYTELRKIGGGFESCIVSTLDLKISENLVKKIPCVSEIKEINNFVARLVAGDEVKDDATNEFQRNLCDVGKIFDDISTEVDNLFDDVMTQRTELVDGFRHKK